VTCHSKPSQGNFTTNAHVSGSQMKPLLLALGLTLGITLPDQSRADGFVSPDILVLGDSQITFGSGPVFLDVFENLTDYCPMSEQQQAQFDPEKVAVIGVRSTSLPTWLARGKKGKWAACGVDPKWKANAGSYGMINRSTHKYVQIGKGKPYQFCEKGQSPFEAMFRDDYYAPKLLVMNFLGNSARTWADDPKTAVAHVNRMVEQLPEDMPCIFMTTAPPFSKKIGALRVRAQASLKAAFEASGSQCSFIEGLTEETIKANQSTPGFFRQRKNGRVKDPYHPNEKGARNYFDLQRDTICNAVHSQLDRLPKPVLAASDLPPPELTSGHPSEIVLTGTQQ
jgi:hypothetical protein